MCKEQGGSGGAARPPGTGGHPFPSGERTYQLPPAPRTGPSDRPPGRPPDRTPGRPTDRTPDRFERCGVAHPSPHIHDLFRHRHNTRFLVSMVPCVIRYPYFHIVWATCRTYRRPMGGHLRNKTASNTELPELPASHDSSCHRVDIVSRHAAAI